MDPEVDFGGGSFGSGDSDHALAAAGQADAGGVNDGLEAVCMLATLQAVLVRRGIPLYEQQQQQQCRLELDRLREQEEDDEDDGEQPQSQAPPSRFLASVLYRLRDSYCDRLRGYISDQREVLKSMTGSVDAKKSKILGPVAAFPTLVAQVHAITSVMVAGQVTAVSGLGVQAAMNSNSPATGVVGVVGVAGGEGGMNMARSRARARVSQVLLDSSALAISLSNDDDGDDNGGGSGALPVSSGRRTGISASTLATAAANVATVYSGTASTSDYSGGGVNKNAITEHWGSLDMVEAALVALTRELLAWMETVSEAYPKYKDVVLLHNLGFFEQAIGEILHRASAAHKKAAAANSGSVDPSHNDGHVRITQATLPPPLGGLARELALVSQWRKKSERRYIDWMVSYELPALQNVAGTLDLIANGTHTPNELALYIKRVEIQGLLAVLTTPYLERAASVMAERIAKHFGTLSRDGDPSSSGSAGEGKASDKRIAAQKRGTRYYPEAGSDPYLPKDQWRTLTRRVCLLVRTLSAGAHASFGLALESGVSEASVETIFKKLEK
jgi:hypothetical protein